MRKSCWFCTGKHLAEAVNYLAESRITDNLVSFWLSIGHAAEAVDESMGYCTNLSKLICIEYRNLERDFKYVPNYMGLLEMVDLLRSGEEIEIDEPEIECPEWLTDRWRRHVAQSIILCKEAKFGYPTHRDLAIGRLDVVESEIYKDYPWIANMIHDERKQMEKPEYEPLLNQILNALLEVPSITSNHRKVMNLEQTRAAWLELSLTNQDL
jgi:hypothetical protein